ncbi:MAG TPA: ATP-binding protein [Ignavibacteriaceae bacterium]
MQHNILERVVFDQLANFKAKDPGVPRDVDFDKAIKSKQIQIVTGIRRCGKSTLLKQLSEKLDSFYYLNFDDERLLKFSVEDFDSLLILWKKLYKSKTIILDEIQNVKNWERFIRRIYDEDYKIILTGSNAKLLSGDLSTHLTGRHIKLELYPFSFSEYLRFKNFDSDKWKTTDRLAKLLRLTDEYVENGGFPEYVIFGDVDYLKRIFEDILYKDLIVRFKIREIKSFRELANFLFTNFTSEISYNSLQRALNFKSVVSVKNYIGHLQESYLLHELYKYDYSLKKQIVYNKKIYSVDNGLRNQVSFRFSEDSGKLLENTVFLQLKRSGKEVYYYKNKRECDFLIKQKTKIVEAIQVTDVLSAANRERELNGLIAAMESFNLKKGLIITRNQEEKFRSQGREIRVLPIYKWLLSKE